MIQCGCGCGVGLPDGWHFVHGHNRAKHGPSRAPAVDLGPKPCAYHPHPEEIPSGLCECGCGGQTSIARYTERAKRYFRGHPVPFIQHHLPKRLGPANHRWKGGRFVHRGYVYVYAPDHPHTNARGYVFEHRLVLEKTLGRLLDPDEDGHHLNHKRADNRPENLIALTREEHGRLHGRPARHS